MNPLYWNQGHRKSCFPIAIGLDACQIFVFSNVTVTRNRADYAGGVFSSLPEGIAVACADDAPHVTARNFTGSLPRAESLLSYCSNISANEISDDGVAHEADAATNVVSLVIEGWNGPLKRVASGKELRIPCQDTRNASCSRELRILVKDIFNQTIVRGVDDANLEIVLVSDAVVGDLRYRAANGIAVINNTAAWGINVSTTLTIVSERDRSIRLDVGLSTRECYPGEINQVNICQRCPHDQYGFDPFLEKCESCEKNAECSGGAALVPKNGYWHSTPFSPVFRQCIEPDACSYEGRSARLVAFYEDGAGLQSYLSALDGRDGQESAAMETADYQQCSIGYEGPLCGSCQDGYGHTYSRKCKECPEGNFKNSLQLLLSCGYLFILIGANCLVTLMSMNSRVELVKHELRCVTRTRPRGIQQLATTSSRQDHSPQSSQRTGVHFIHGISNDRCADGSAESGGTVTVNTQQIFAKQLIATVQLTETLKVRSQVTRQTATFTTVVFQLLINYLQVTSIALRLQTDWNSVLKGLLKLQGSVSLPAPDVTDVSFRMSWRVVQLPCLCSIRMSFRSGSHLIFRKRPVAASQHTSDRSGRPFAGAAARLSRDQSAQNAVGKCQPARCGSSKAILHLCHHHLHRRSLLLLHRSCARIPPSHQLRRDPGFPCRPLPRPPLPAVRHGGGRSTRVGRRHKSGLLRGETSGGGHCWHRRSVLSALRHRLDRCLAAAQRKKPTQDGVRCPLLVSLSSLPQEVVHKRLGIDHPCPQNTDRYRHRLCRSSGADTTSSDVCRHPCHLSHIAFTHFAIQSPRGAPKHSRVCRQHFSADSFAGMGGHLGQDEQCHRSQCPRIDVALRIHHYVLRCHRTP